LPANLHVSNPRMWPWFSTPLDRRLNRFLLARPLAAPPSWGRPPLPDRLPARRRPDILSLRQIPARQPHTSGPPDVYADPAPRRAPARPAFGPDAVGAAGGSGGAGPARQHGGPGHGRVRPHPDHQPPAGPRPLARLLVAAGRRRRHRGR